MKSDVFYFSFKKNKKSVLQYIDALYDNSKLKVTKKNALIAVKLHMGEIGNTSFIKPLFVKKIIENLKKDGLKPFLTDTTTLYIGQRSNAVDYLNAAVYNGFGYESIGCPIIISDGLRSQNGKTVETKFSSNFQIIKYASDIAHSDGVVVLSHVKGHVVAGYGGALKNIAMGMATRSTKQQMHGDVKPQIKTEKCSGCGTCVAYCPGKAITIKDGKAVFNLNHCIGCADCITVCTTGCLKVLKNESSEKFLEKMGDVIYAIVNDFKKPMTFFNFVMDVTPDCDCLDYSRYPIVPDIGILASYDPVAIDKASIDLIKSEPYYFNQDQNDFELAVDQDKFCKKNGNVNYDRLLKYCENLGVGSTEYNLVELTY
ncbi:MAG TPA: DUF362 domain-containing protein [Exilispira sp.]|nr:DUF362 domain-containing protein [Exilispira sp.]HQQ18775.1 DUF362 domain-containing protein [Exilispira sp.]